MDAQRVPCVGAVIRDDRGRLLLVRRGTEPGRGRWSVPGGRVERGETSQQAALREVVEETGLHVVLTGVAGVVERPGPDGVLYEIEDYYARLEAGTEPEHARAGDDAADVGWFTADEMTGLDCVPGLLDALRDWSVIARPGG